MKNILDFVSRFSRRSRIVVALAAFAMALVGQWIAFVYASLTGNDAWILAALASALAFAVFVTPIVVSIVNENYEARGIRGMFYSE
ncbi:MAG TPA: hypothetical protein VJB97_00930 [Candidatus Paceibacterota bacterium]